VSDLPVIFRLLPMAPVNASSSCHCCSTVHRGTRCCRLSTSAELSGLAHRRLSMLDVAAGHQPLANDNGTVWVAFNGEISTSRILRQQSDVRCHVCFR